MFMNEFVRKEIKMATKELRTDNIKALINEYWFHRQEDVYDFIIDNYPSDVGYEELEGIVLAIEICEVCDELQLNEHMTDSTHYGMLACPDCMQDID